MNAELPVVFLAFANDRDDRVRYLRNLPDEKRRVFEILNAAEQQGLCEVVERTNATSADVFKVFQDPQYRNRIAVFHFAGHANGYQLLLESSDGQVAAANAVGFSSFLGQQKGLHLVFLNGCSTKGQVEGLLDEGVAAVIATSSSIDDHAATDFSAHFYRSLAGGADVQTSYNEAAAATQTDFGSETRALYFKNEDDSLPAEVVNRLPWDLFLKDGDQKAAEWNLPDAADNPLAAIPALPDQVLPHSPYRKLQPFGREHAHVFFGRRHETRDLYRQVTSPQSAPIILYCGQSGVGKSSLLKAGLLPRLEDSHDVRYLRRNQDESVRTTLRRLVSSEGLDRPLHETWHSTEKTSGKPLFVVVDQLEEVFTHPIAARDDELEELVGDLERLFADQDGRPTGKLVLCFRKEWLAEVEGNLLERQLPFSRVILERLNRSGVIEVVRGPSSTDTLRAHFHLEVEDDLATMIADSLLADQESSVAPIMQVLLTQMWEEASKDQNTPKLSCELYSSLRRDGKLLGGFLDEQIFEIRGFSQAAVDSGLLLDILAQHTTPLGTSTERRMSELEEAYSHLDDGVLPSLVQHCSDSCLLLTTKASGNGSEDEKITRLSHSTLAPLIRSRFGLSNLPGQQARRIVNNRMVTWTDGATGSPLSEQDLDIVEKGSLGTRIATSEETRLLEASRELRKRQRRKKLIIRALGVAGVICVATFGVSAWSSAADVYRKRENIKDTYTIAEDAIASYHRILNENQDLPIVQEDHVEGVIKFFEQFIKNNQEDDSLGLQVGDAYHKLADIKRLIGDHDKAIEHTNHSIEILKRSANLQMDDEQKENAALALSNAYTSKAHILRKGKLKDLNEAFKNYQLAWEERDRLVKNNSTDSELQRKFASAYMNKATLEEDMDLDPMPDLEMAQAIRKAELARVKDETTRNRLLVDQAKGYFNLARIHQQAKNKVESKINSTEAVRLFEELLGEKKNDPHIRFELAKARSLHGMVVYRNGEKVEALNLFHQAAQTLGGLCKEFDQVGSYKEERDRTMNTINGLARLASNSIKDTETLLSQNKNDPKSRFELAKEQFVLATALKSGNKVEALLHASETSLEQLHKEFNDNEEYKAELERVAEARRLHEKPGNSQKTDQQ